jgi:hypothetical protein
MKDLISRSGLHDCVQFYARILYGAPDGVAEGLMTDEMLVYTVFRSLSPIAYVCDRRKRAEKARKSGKRAASQDCAG